jgi:hypothetical protein
MYRFFIQTQNATSIITGEKMFVDGDYLFVYSGEDLIGMFKADAVIDAHRTEGK